MLLRVRSRGATPWLMTMAVGMAALLFAPSPDPHGFAPGHREDRRPLPVIPPIWPTLGTLPHARECGGEPGGGPGKAVRPAYSPGDWVTPDDYPADALMRNQTGVTYFRLSVDSEGSPSACEVTRASGAPSLDAAACGALMRRARFTPAEDGRGCPIPSSYSSAVRWQIPVG